MDKLATIIKHHTDNKGNNLFLYDVVIRSNNLKLYKIPATKVINNMVSIIPNNTLIILSEVEGNYYIRDVVDTSIEDFYKKEEGKYNSEISKKLSPGDTCWSFLTNGMFAILRIGMLFFMNQASHFIITDEGDMKMLLNNFEMVFAKFGNIIAKKTLLGYNLFFDMRTKMTDLGDRISLRIGPTLTDPMTVVEFKVNEQPACITPQFEFAISDLTGELVIKHLKSGSCFSVGGITSAGAGLGYITISDYLNTGAAAMNLTKFDTLFLYIKALEEYIHNHTHMYAPGPGLPVSTAPLKTDPVYGSVYTAYEKAKIPLKEATRAIKIKSV